MKLSSRSKLIKILPFQLDKMIRKKALKDSDIFVILIGLQRDPIKLNSKPSNWYFRFN